VGIGLMDLPLALLYLTSAVVAGGVAVISWRRRSRTPAAVGLTLAMTGLVWWALADIASTAAAAVPAPRIGAAAVAWIVPGAAIVALGFALLCAWVVDRDWRPSRRTTALLGIEPVLTVLGALTDPWWHLLVAGWDPAQGGGPRWAPGPGFWLHTAYCYTIMGWAAGRLVRSARHASPTYRRQVRSLLGAGLFPMVGNLITVFTPLGRSLPDLSALGFALTGLVDGYALFRQGLLNLVPVARGQVLDRLSDAVVVVDPDGRVIDVNAQGALLARRLAPDLPADLAGVPAQALLGGRPVRTPWAPGEYRVVLDGVATFLDVRVEDLVDRRGRPLATVFVVRDVTAAHRQRADLTAANAQLLEANRQLEHQVATVEGLRAELAEQAVRDELTGLHNRRHLLAALDRDVAAALTAGGDLCVAMFDLDHFKNVNDTYGHDVGDELLRATARSLAGALGPADTLARYGGEEFVVLMPGTTLEHAAARAQELRQRCADVTLSTERGPLSTTASIGVSSLRHTAGPTAGALLKAADQALYRAKAGGRNRVVLATDPHRPAAPAPPPERRSTPVAPADGGPRA
jgi:diguanylate cyclase (GGDEF)-like protein